MSSLNTLLERAQHHAPTYSTSHLSNHLPMALVALHALGATAGQMEQAFACFSGKLDYNPPVLEPSPDWTQFRGQRAAFAAVRAHFIRDISARGIDAALRTALPYLIEGVGGAAFHGLLRTASALVARHDEELASGLAHWSCSYMPLLSCTGSDAAKDAPSRPQKLELHAWLSELTATPLSSKSPSGMIATLMRNYSKSESFQTTAPRLQVREGTLRTLAMIALDHYLRSRNFTVLHLITGTHAMHILSPYFDDQELAVLHYAVAFAAGVAASGIDPKAALLAVTPQPWVTLKAIACDATDEHIIKIIYACEAEWQVTQDDRYRVAASLAASSHEA